MASSSSGTTIPNINYDVFVSCCSEDTGATFTSHLLSAFKREEIIAFIEDRQDEGEPPKIKQKLDKGEEISETILNKISESLVSLLILSENYGGSPRRLDELVEIIRCMKDYGRNVLPVFRGVEPTHVRKQSGAFGEAFKEMLTRNQQAKQKEEKWRSALVEAAAISGWDSHNTSSEAEMVNKVVERIKKIVNKLLPLKDFDDGFVGIARVDEVESLLRLELTEYVQSVGIWGMGGIGKTRIAKRVYSRIKNQFDGACFLTNVGARLKRGELKSVLKDMLKQLLGYHNFRGSFDFSTMSIRNIQRKKFLIVFDDVTKSLEIKDLVKPHNFYGLGSRIILTSRDKQVLKNCDCEENYIYEVKELNHSEALMLFEYHAFKQQPCIERYKDLSKKALNYAKGLPLGLIVLGCNLYGKDVGKWGSVLKKLEENPDRQINDILMISYEGLDETQQHIFLDIVCVFLGWSKYQVE